MDVFIDNIRQEFATPFKSSVLVFSVILIIILLAPLILRKIKIPGIIGLIISGVVIGPHGLNIIERDSAIELFSTIGLLYIMFIAGLELDLSEFLKYRYKSLIFGFLTFIIPIGIGLPVCLYLLDYGFNTSLLTASMFATHTLIAYPIVSRMGISKNEAVAISVGGTILTDTAVLTLLAFITNTAAGEDGHTLWIRLGLSFIVYLLFVVFGISSLARWAFKRLETERNSQYIFVLFVVFLCAFTARIAGLEPIVGAFAAGLVLNKFVPHSSALMNRIDFVGNSLFIPFFLISVGMIVDLTVITNGPRALIVALVLSIVALIGKWSAAFSTSFFLKYSKPQRNLIFGLSSAHAAATLAIISIGYKMNIIDENIFNGTIVLILITCLVATLVTERASKIIVLQNEHFHKHESLDTKESIIVLISNPQTMNRLMDLALLMKSKDSLKPILGLSVVEDDEKAYKKLAVSQKNLERSMEHAMGSDQKVEVIATIDQNISSGILRVSKEVDATDILMGSFGKSNVVDFFFGRNIQQILGMTVQNIIMFNPTLPLNVLKKIHIIFPEHSEKEPGYKSWMNKVILLSEVLNLKMFFYSNNDSLNQLKEHPSIKSKTRNHIKYNTIEDWKQFIKLTRTYDKDDLIVVIAPRRGSVSYFPGIETVISKLAKFFSDKSYIIFYPAINKKKNKK